MKKNRHSGFYQKKNQSTSALENSSALKSTKSSFDSPTPRATVCNFFSHATSAPAQKFCKQAFSMLLSAKGSAAGLASNKGRTIGSRCILWVVAAVAGFLRVRGSAFGHMDRKFLRKQLSPASALAPVRSMDAMRD